MICFLDTRNFICFEKIVGPPNEKNLSIAQGFLFVLGVLKFVDGRLILVGGSCGGTVGLLGGVLGLRYTFGSAVVLFRGVAFL